VDWTASCYFQHHFPNARASHTLVTRADTSTLGGTFHHFGGADRLRVLHRELLKAPEDWRSPKASLYDDKEPLPEP
jgi:hypothetical protein